MSDAAGPLDLGEALSKHHTRCYGWALACCRWDQDESEDVLQAAYLKVLEGRARFGGRSSFASWIFGVIRTTAAEQRRQRWHRRRAWQRWLPLEAQSVLGPERGAGADADRLRRELTALPSRQREVLHLVFYGDLSIREAAHVMGVALGTARTHYERGKNRMRRRLLLAEKL